MTKEKYTCGEMLVALRAPGTMAKAAAYVMADACGVTPQTWYRWEHGTRAPTIPNLTRIAAAFRAHHEHFEGSSVGDDYEDLVYRICSTELSIASDLDLEQAVFLALAHSASRSLEVATAA